MVESLDVLCTSQVLHNERELEHMRVCSDGQYESLANKNVRNGHRVRTGQLAIRCFLHPDVGHLTGELLHHGAGRGPGEYLVRRRALPGLRVGVESVILDVGREPPRRDVPSGRARGLGRIGMGRAHGDEQQDSQNAEPCRYREDATSLAGPAHRGVLSRFSSRTSAAGSGEDPQRLARIVGGRWECWTGILLTSSEWTSPESDDPPCRSGASSMRIVAVSDAVGYAGGVPFGWMNGVGRSRLLRGTEEPAAPRRSEDAHLASKMLTSWG